MMMNRGYELTFEQSDFNRTGVYMDRNGDESYLHSPPYLA